MKSEEQGNDRSILAPERELLRRSLVRSTVAVVVVLLVYMALARTNVKHKLETVITSQAL
jgi:hypothetical protein